MGGPLKVEEAGAERFLAVDGFSGRVHVEWDAEVAVTPLGQLAFFVAFVKQGGLFDALVADYPLELTSPNAPAGERRRSRGGTGGADPLAGGKRAERAGRRRSRPRRPRFALNLLRARGAAPGTWLIEWDHATRAFSLVALLVDRESEPAPSGIRRARA